MLKVFNKASDSSLRQASSEVLETPHPALARSITHSRGPWDLAAWQSKSWKVRKCRWPPQSNTHVMSSCCHSATLKHRGNSEVQSQFFPQTFCLAAKRALLQGVRNQGVTKGVTTGVELTNGFESYTLQVATGYASDCICMCICMCILPDLTEVSSRAFMKMPKPQVPWHKKNLR